jgi:hypothetical protein
MLWALLASSLRGFGTPLLQYCCESEERGEGNEDLRREEKRESTGGGSLEIETTPCASATQLFPCPERSTNSGMDLLSLSPNANAQEQNTGQGCEIPGIMINTGTKM